MARKHPRFAGADAVKRLVRSVLSDNLVRTKYRVDWGDRRALRRYPRFEGHCYAASEAYWHLKGGPHSGLRPKQLTLEEDGEPWSHRWLETDDGEIIDLTIANEADERKMRRYPYEDGRHLPFMKSKGPRSIRAQEIVDRFNRAKDLRLT